MIGLKDALSAGKAFHAALKGEVEAPEEIHRRESVCAQCPMRRFKRGGMTPISKILGKLANQYRVPKNISNYACDVCGCSFMLLLPATEEHWPEDSPEEAEKRPESCWLRKPREKIL